MLGILFDYNGVLVDDEHLHWQTMSQTLGEYGIDLPRDYYYEKWVGRTDEEQLKQARAKHKDKLGNVSLEQLMSEKMELYLDLLPKTDIMPEGVPELVAELAQENKLGIVSGARREEIEKVLARNNITTYFEFIVSSEETTKSKPNPEGYLAGLKKLGTNKEETVVIEDSVYGVAAAHAAGLKCIAVQTTTPKEKLEEAAADLIIPSVVDLTPPLLAQVRQ